MDFTTIAPILKKGFITPRKPLKQAGASNRNSVPTSPIKNQTATQMGGKK